MKEAKSVVSNRFLPTLYVIAIATDMDNLRKHGKYKFPIYLTSEMENTDIENLDLSVRSINCLHRAGLHTIGDLVNSINSDDDLKRIRCCGKTSIREIMTSLMCFQYEVLSAEKRKSYIQRIIELNKR